MKISEITSTARALVKCLFYPKVIAQSYIDLEEQRIRAKAAAHAAGHPEWDNACLVCGSQITIVEKFCNECTVKKLAGI